MNNEFPHVSNGIIETNNEFPLKSNGIIEMINRIAAREKDNKARHSSR